MVSRTIVMFGIAVFALVAGGLYISFEGGSAPNSVQVSIRLVEIGGQRYWEPSTVQVKTGQSVTFVVSNGDDEDNHVLSIRDLNVSTTPILPGATSRITFVAPQPGNYTFYDPLPPTPTDPLRNEVGTLIVTSG